MQEVVIAVACNLVAEVDSVLPTDPVAPSSTGHRFYLLRARRVFRLISGFAEFGEQVTEAMWSRRLGDRVR